MTCTNANGRFQLDITDDPGSLVARHDLPVMWSTTLRPLCCGVHYVAPGLSPASHAGNINLERHITRGDPLEGGPSNPSSASHEPLSAHRQPPPRQEVALGLQ